MQRRGVKSILEDICPMGSRRRDQGRDQVARMSGRGREMRGRVVYILLTSP